MWNWFSMNDREAVQSDIFLTVNIQMWHKCDYVYLINTNCPSLMHGNAICYVQHSQAMLESGDCELAHSFSHL